MSTPARPSADAPAPGDGSAADAPAPGDGPAGSVRPAGTPDR
jgi:hypothetical protein